MAGRIGRLGRVVAAAALAGTVLAAPPLVAPVAGAAQGATAAVVPAAPTDLALQDLDGRPVRPFQASEGRRAVIFLFAAVECPVSNRYAPVVQQLHEAFAPQGAAFWLVYPNPYDTPAAIRAHLRDYAYPVHALRDPDHRLVALTAAQVTPEGAVFRPDRTLAYHGRIDNRFVSLGVERPSATVHDLRDAIGAVLGGRPVATPSAPGVGCFIADFVP